MFKKLAVLLALTLTVAGCSSMKVHVDYDQSADVEAFETFMFKDTPDGSLSGTAPLIHQRIVNAIETSLLAGGLSKVTSSPDLFVTYYASTDERVRVDTAYYGYGYPSRWYRYPYYGSWGGAASTTTVSSYDVGTLVIDVWDTGKETLIWRGVAQDTVPSSPDKLSTKIDKALSRMVSESKKKM